MAKKAQTLKARQPAKKPAVKAKKKTPIKKAKAPSVSKMIENYENEIIALEDEKTELLMKIG